MNAEPVVLELASLPREQAGPLLILGLDKTADKDAIDAHWAERLKLARKGQLKVALEDVNWARDALADRTSRLRADATGLNLDSGDQLLHRLTERYGTAFSWRPMDCEKPIEAYIAHAEIPDPREIASRIAIPELPQELASVEFLLKQFAAEPLDPWALTLPESAKIDGSSAKDASS